MRFGLAIVRVKLGQRMTRQGWNGKQQYIEIAQKISYVNAKGEIVNADHADIGSQAIAFVDSRGVQLGWVASQADLLANDWVVYTEPSFNVKG